jgi:inner membrane protein
MDNVTHALAGLLLGEATVAVASRRSPVSAGFRRAALVLGVVAAELPDADLLYAGPVLGMGKLGYMLHHRGHTHTVVFALLGALALWGITLAIARGVRERPHERRWLLALAATGTLVAHIALDWTNNYGVHPFWPLDDRWYYGDSVFIVEPWLWIASIPPLLFLERSVVVRVLLSLALVGILALAFTSGMVSATAWVVLATAAAAALGVAFVARAAPPRRLVAVAVVAWLAVEATFIGTSRVVRGMVAGAVGPTLVDASLTPAVGDPLCWNAIVMQREGPTLRVRRATVAPLPALRSVRACARVPGRSGAAPRTRRVTRTIAWGGDTTMPVASLVDLARRSCDVAAALRFIRVPTWGELPDGRVRVADLRYSGGGGGFAELVVEPRATGCTGPIPPWVPPRRDLLEGDAE